MSYTVLILPTAERELEEAYQWLASQTELHAPTWYNAMLDAILSLGEMPARHPFVRDRAHDDRETRQYVYGSGLHAYLIFYIIRGDRVLVTHIRHGARKR